ncbi:MAG: signal peptidase I [Patescibacteria group bacterium]
MSDEQTNFNEPIVQPSRLRVAGAFLFELIKVIVMAGVTIALIRYFLFKPFYVKGASMEPNFMDHEYLIIDELSYRLRLPERGEVIVFKYPNNKQEYFLKRIIGLPGERVKVADGHVTIYNNAHPEGVVVSEGYLPDELITAGDNQTVTLGVEDYFVLGDNRPNSFDSRRFGSIKKDLIVGKVFIRGWPLSRIQKFSAPSFGNLNN